MDLFIIGSVLGTIATILIMLFFVNVIIRYIKAKKAGELEFCASPFLMKHDSQSKSRTWIYNVDDFSILDTAVFGTVISILTGIVIVGLWYIIIPGCILVMISEYYDNKKYKG